MALQNYICTQLFPLQILEHKFDTVDGFRNHSVVFLTKNFGYINTQCNRYWSTENHCALYEVPLHDLNLESGVQLVCGG
jgi:hypothetical protein